MNDEDDDEEDDAVNCTDFISRRRRVSVDAYNYT